MLTEKMYGEIRHNTLPVVADDSELEALWRKMKVKHIVKKKKSGIDLFANKKVIERFFLNKEVYFRSNDINPNFPTTFHENPLEPQSLTVFDKFDFVVTVPPMEHADIVVPLLALKFSAVFLLLPANYVFNGSVFRKKYLTTLADAQRLVIIATSRERNVTSKTFMVWIAIFANKDLAHYYLADRRISASLVFE
jgi:hypothetical protein